MTNTRIEPNGLLNAPPAEMYSAEGITRRSEIIQDPNKALPGDIFTTTETMMDTNSKVLSKDTRYYVFLGVEDSREVPFPRRYSQSELKLNLATIHEKDKTELFPEYIRSEPEIWDGPYLNTSRAISEDWEYDAGVNGVDFLHKSTRITHPMTKKEASDLLDAITENSFSESEDREHEDSKYHLEKLSLMLMEATRLSEQLVGSKYSVFREVNTSPIESLQALITRKMRISEG